ncbi:beta-ketoacyl synthase N-terminal-like domain-containing protein [Kitasatospora sp. NPDC056327]|uniref:beta-ketoacyl synthase N-terminal-like domain-containing protein n=1 Tax=Kitasatospora sp. NPDC056327 TaxID=3345785 RepID=UPI0035E07D33
MTATVISAWSVLSPYGTGPGPFADGITAGRPVAPGLDRDTWHAPPTGACLVPGFDTAAALGTRGTRTMDRLTGLTVATLGTLLAPGAGPGTPDGGGAGPGLLTDHDRTALVLGTGSGSVQSTMDFTRDALTGAKPFHVDPARFPNTVMNRAAGASAIWYGLKGPNATLAGGPLTALQALRYATRLRERGHCRTVLCAAVEEYSEERAWLAWHTRDDRHRATPLAEACAVFLLEDAEDAAHAGRAPLADVLAVRFGAAPGPGGLAATLGRLLREALREAGADPGEVRWAAPSRRTTAPPGTCPMGFGAAPRPVEEAEREALRDVLPPGGARPIDVQDLLGDAGAASAGLQIAAVLAEAARRPQPGGIGVVTAVDEDGLAACLVLRLR